MPIEHTNIYNTYRNYLPSGSYDMAIISLVHQGNDMIKYMAGNIERFVKGKYIWIIHYNGNEHVDENSLPEWVWIVRDSIKTTHGGVSLLQGLGKCLKLAHDNITFINCMVFSSGSMFIREYIVPLKETICAESHEDGFNPNINLLHVSPIPIKYLGSGGKYLLDRNHSTWQYGHDVGGFDKDIEAHMILRKRGFEYTKGCQSSGQVFPYVVSKMLADDLYILSSRPFYSHYCQEEILPSTYSYWYSQLCDIPIQKTTVCINWEYNYEIDSLDYVELIHDTMPNAYAVCKVTYDLNNPVRTFYAGPKK